MKPYLLDLIAPLALDYHRSPEGEREYGCPGETCPGVKRLTAFGVECVEAALAAPKGSEWQPIETAPKYRCKVIVLWPNGDMELLPAIACASLQRLARDGDGNALGGYMRPTHWTPIPSLPHAM